MPSPRLLDQVRDRLRVKHYSMRTEDTYLHWIRRFILFHGKKHPREMGGPAGRAVSVASRHRRPRRCFDAKSGAVCVAVSLPRGAAARSGVVGWLGARQAAEARSCGAHGERGPGASRATGRHTLAGCRSAVQLGDAPVGGAASARQGCGFRAP